MKAHRVKPVSPEEKKKLSDSARARWLSLVVGESFKKVLSDAFKFVVIAALLGGGWYLYQNSRPAPVQEPEQPSSGIEARFSELIGSLEKYHADKGMYPKKLRDAYDVQGKPASGLIYRGTGRELVLTESCAENPLSDPCWTGFKKFELAAEDTGKAYVYSSESKSWKETHES